MPRPCPSGFVSDADCFVVQTKRNGPPERAVRTERGRPALHHDDLGPDVDQIIKRGDVLVQHAGWTREQLKPYIAHAIECFGFERSMYGGDWHVMELAIAYPEWVGIVDWVIEGASAAEKERLFRGTATEFYRLDR